MRSQQRKEQIIDATLRLVAERGVAGTTLNGIAAAVGVTTPALYVHFANRREILLAAFAALSQRRGALVDEAREGTSIERLREIGHRQWEMLASQDGKSLLALFEFIAAAPYEGLRETLRDWHLLLVERIAEVVKQGQKEGTITKETDPQQIAWMLVSRAWTNNIANLLDLAEFWNKERSNEMLELILGSITVSGNRAESAPGDE